MTPRKLDVLIASFPYGGNGASASEHPDVRNYLVKLAPQLKDDERIGRVRLRDWNDTPITMTRNASVKYAQDNGFDVILMVDSDQAPDYLIGQDPRAVPFWDEAFGFLYDNYDKGPQVVGAPYMGGPPDECVFVFRWRNHESDNPGVDWKLDQYAREEAATLAGIQECAALPTGLILFDVRAFDLIAPSYDEAAESTEKANREKSWFYYEYTDIYCTKKASTEDVTATRDISMCGQAALGYNPIHCAWSSWAGHHKTKCVGKPNSITAGQIKAKYQRALELGHNEDFQSVEVDYSNV